MEPEAGLSAALRVAYLQLPHATVLVDGDGRCIETNPAALRFFGRDVAATREQLDRFVAVGPSPFAAGPIAAQGECRLCNDDGAMLDVEYTAIPDAMGPGTRIVTLRDITHRKAVEHRLEQSEARLRLAQTAARMGTWDWEVATNTVTWSPEMERLYGLAPGEFSGSYDDYISRIHPDDREAMVASVEGMLRTGYHDMEHRVLLPDGSIRWLAARGQTFTDDAGNVVRAIGIGMDITARRQRDEAFDFIIEASRVLGSSLDYEETLQRVAQLAVPVMADWCAVHVVTDTPGELQEVTVTHTDPSRIAWVRELQQRYPAEPGQDTGVRRVIRTGEPEFVPEITEEMIDAAGLDEDRATALRQLRLRSYLCVPMTTRGRTLGAITFASAESRRNYTQQDLEVAQHLARRAALAVDNARAHREVQRERARFSSIVDSVNAGVHHLAQDGTLLYMNPSAEHMLRQPAQALLGTKVCETVHGHNVAEGHPAKGACPILAVIQTGEAFRGETFYRRGDGSYFPVEVASAPIEIDGRAEGVVVVYHDITERLAEQRQKDDFLAFASHELRSPLSPILGFSRWLAQHAAGSPGVFDEDALDAITFLKSESERMARVVDLFLDLSRIESGRMGPRISRANLVDVLRTEARELAVRFPGVTLTVDCALESLVCLSDEPRFRQVLGNLLENAAKYGGEGVSIKVTAHASDGTFHCSVADDGPGITEDDLPHIFERFVRGTSPTTTAVKGSGVGLFITRQMVEMVGGAIEVESAAGDGTCFTVHWPFEPAS